MVVLRYANIKEEEAHAKTVEVVRYANIRGEEMNAKTVEVLVYANTRDCEVGDYVGEYETISFKFKSVKEERRMSLLL